MQEETALSNPTANKTAVKLPLTGEPTESSAPRIALLGWCDRDTQITAGHPALWHRNVMGISASRVSHVFPLSLQGHSLVLALYSPSSDESFNLVFRRQNSNDFWELTITIQDVQTIDPQTNLPQPLPKGTQIPGWSLHTIQIGVNTTILEPGQFDVFLKRASGETFLTTMNLVHASAPALTPEEIAAIRSDPLGLKLIRLGVSCRECKDTFRTYSGIERNSQLENDGWSWYDSLPDRFTCRCGKMDFPLEYVKSGLPGLLRRKITPMAGQSIDYVRLYEVSALEQDCREFKQLMDSSHEEEKYQVFLEKHPVFLSRFGAKKLMHKKPVLSKYVVDFAVLNERRELILVEIERPTIPLLKSDGGIRAELQHAISQVKNWMQVFDDHRAAALECMGLNLAEVARVRGAVIAGRTPPQEEEARTLRGWSWQGIELYTYDDLLHQTNEIIRHVATT